MAGDEDERALRAFLLIGPDLRLRLEAIAFLLGRRRGRERVDAREHIEVVVDLVLHAEVGHAFRDRVLAVHEVQLHRAFAPLRDLLTPGAAEEVAVIVVRSAATGDRPSMNHHEAAAALRVGVDGRAFLRLEVAANLAVDDEDIGFGQLRGGREGVAAIHLGAAFLEQGHPVAQEGRVIMVAGAVGLRAGAEEDPERLRARARRGNRVGAAGLRGHVGGENSAEGQEGEQATHA